MSSKEFLILRSSLIEELMILKQESRNQLDFFMRVFSKIEILIRSNKYSNFYLLSCLAAAKSYTAKQMNFENLNVIEKKKGKGLKRKEKNKTQNTLKPIQNFMIPIPEKSRAPITEKNLFAVPEKNLLSFPQNSIFGIPQKSIFPVSQKTIFPLPEKSIFGIPQKSIFDIPERSIFPATQQNIDSLPEKKLFVSVPQVSKEKKSTIPAEQSPLLTSRKVYELPPPSNSLDCSPRKSNHKSKGIFSKDAMPNSIQSPK